MEHKNNTVRLTRAFFLILLGVFCIGSLTFNAYAKQPNVIVILVDDQGYGDLAAHGNPWLKTPAMDELYHSSLRFTDFHVDPTCSPSRAALMTGKYSTKVGVWLTYAGREHLKRNEKTMADVFKSNGYSTAIFGKWHLGENYPFRPMDRGFDESLIHGGGSITETPDTFGNDYYDDIYKRNGKAEQVSGYATDVWFKETQSFIQRQGDKPFFVYLPLNAAHSPLTVPEKYAKPYQNKAGIPARRANFYGMLANIDENLANLRKTLKQQGIADNTILLFLNDNGTGHGVKLAAKNGQGNTKDGWAIDGYNAGMRGRKSSVYDGGHRSFLFMHWPNGGLDKGRDFPHLTAHFDLLPSLIEMCGLALPEPINFDGISLLPYIQTEKQKQKQYPDRTIVVHHQGRRSVKNTHLQKYKDYVVMTEQWRLVGKELYAIKTDPAQAFNLAHKYPKVVKQLSAEYENWWQSVEFADDKPEPIVLNPRKQHTLVITTQNLQGMQRAHYSQFDNRAGKLATDGYTHIYNDIRGKYKITLRRWPRELDLAINAKGEDFKLDPTKHDAFYPFHQYKNKALQLSKARLKIGKFDETKPVKANDTEIVFKAFIPAGEFTIQTWFYTKDNQQTSAYYTYIEPDL
ncbi:arylsulfatase [Saccharobesus litoralis]|nr:arylsulfatase [Saccharobesus litoralis]